MIGVIGNGYAGATVGKVGALVNVGYRDVPGTENLIGQAGPYGPENPIEIPGHGALKVKPRDITVKPGCQSSSEIDRDVAAYRIGKHNATFTLARSQVSYISQSGLPHTESFGDPGVGDDCLTEHPGAALDGSGHLGTAERYYDTPFVDYVMNATAATGDLELSCRRTITWSRRLRNHVPPKPVINGETWYEGLSGGTAEIAVHLGYLSLLSGNAGYTYGTSLWNARDADLPTWKEMRGATYMQYLYDFFVTLDEGRPMRPRPNLIKNQPRRYQDRMVAGVSADGQTYAAFLPKGGTIQLSLTALPGAVGVTWYNPLTGQYHDQGTALGGAVHAFTSPFGTGPAALVVIAQ